VKYPLSEDRIWTIHVQRTAMNCDKVQQTMAVSIVKYIEHSCDRTQGYCTEEQCTGRIKSMQAHPLVSGFIRMHPGDLDPS
jgi:hypothetical protein